MLSTSGNTHHSKLPSLGQIVNIRGLERNGFNSRERWIVESFPLCDAADWRYSRGIHTVHVRRLRDSRRARVSGFYCLGD